MSRWFLISDGWPVKCLLEENRSGLATKTGLFDLMMVIHFSLFLIKVNQMVKRMVLWVPRLWKSSLRRWLMQENMMFTLITFLLLSLCLKSWKTCHYQPQAPSEVTGHQVCQVRQMLKLPRKVVGLYMPVCSTNDVCPVCWVDNKVATFASNHLTHKPS